MRVARVIESLTLPFFYAAWWLRGLRRCPQCKLTWEPRTGPASMDTMGGVCHDCFAWGFPEEVDSHG